MSVEIPKVHFDEATAPGWIGSQTTDGKACKPIIRCQCGKHCGIGLHHVHSDGTVTASFHHAAAHELEKIGDQYFFNHKGKKYQTEPGCGWHVFLKLKDYDRGEFPPTE